MSRLGVASSALLLLLSACSPARVEPAPVGPIRVQTTTPPRSILRTAAQQLAAAGFLITAIDSTARLRAEREHHAGEFEGDLTCRSATTPAGRASVAPTLILDVAVQPRIDGGSELIVASRVHANYLRLTADPPRPSSDSDCRSTGAVEKQLAESLSARQP
jgi:hypothetical protein